MAARNHIDLVVKAIRVFETLAQGEPAKSLKEIASRAGLVKSSAFRILYTLKELGYVEQAGENGSYSLTLKTAGLAPRAAGRPKLAEVARPHLSRLRDQLNESAWLAERRRNSVILVDVVEALHPLRLSFDIGDRCPLHATALGKAVAAHLPPEQLAACLGSQKLRRFTPNTATSRSRLAAELEKVRRAGYSMNREETVRGAILIGAAVFDANKTVCGAVSVSAPTARCSADRLKKMIFEVRRASASITADLAQFGFESPDYAPPRNC